MPAANRPLKALKILGEIFGLHFDVSSPAVFMVYPLVSIYCSAGLYADVLIAPPHSSTVKEKKRDD